MTPTHRLLEERLTAAFAPEHLEILDDSARHAGHPGAAAGGGHFQVLLVSPAFDGKPLLERHRLVNAVLRDLIGGAVHALGLKTMSPSEWAAARGPV